MLHPNFPLVLGVSLLLLAPSLSAQGSSQSNPPPPPPAGDPAPRPLDWQPNVLVILCDQFSARMLGHEDNGWGGLNESLTPNLDELATEGVRFTQAACVSAVCQPSRYSIMTGRWPFHHGVRANQIWEPRTETTFAELARAAGYRTANIGLHHLMWDNQPEGWGDDHGFDEILDMGDYVTHCAANGQLPYNAASNVWLMPDLPEFGEFEDTGYTLNSNEYHPAGYFADQVIDFLRQRAGPQGDGQPFVCWYSMISPHTPILPSGVAPDDWAHRYHPFGELSLAPNLEKVPSTLRLNLIHDLFDDLTDSELREALSYYYGLVSQVDWNIGRVLDELDQLGIADDTLVVFTTDHGEMASEMHCFTKGQGSYDALTRVPLLARLPGILPAGKVVSEPVINVDIFPTLVETTGVPIPEPVRSAVDGASLVDLMTTDTPPAGWRQETYHVHGTTKFDVGHHFAVRTATAKYTMDEMDGSQEFYDLASDPWELDDLFTSPDAGVQAQIADLRGRFTAWWNNGQGHAPHYSIIGAWGAAPTRPSDPAPADGATDVPRDADPRWVPCTGAAIQRVFFGTSPGSLSEVTTLQHMEDRYNPGTLEPAATYYWRVDQVNANGTGRGPTWSFTTTAGGSGGPGLPADPLPMDRETDVLQGSMLAWTVAPGTVSQDLYFGQAGQLQLAAAGLPETSATWDPGALSGGVTYEWRVDASDANGTTQGDLWRFEVTSQGLPGRARPRTPVHFQTELPDSPLLAWSAGAEAASHDVYFGTSFPLAFQVNQAGTTWSPGPLAGEQTYYWRIDEVNASGSTTGLTWRFRR